MPIHESILGLAKLGVELELLSLEMESWRAVLTNSRQAEERMTRMARAASKMGIEKCRRWWVPRRLSVSLQVRLFLEAVFFSMGKPWSDLVSGFKPLRVQLGAWRS